MTESTNLKRHLTLALDQLLKEALLPGEETVISLNGSFGEAIAVTNRRVIVLREATTIGAAQKEQVFPYPLTDVESVTMSASDVAGQLILEVVETGGRVPPIEKRSIGFPVAQFEVFERAAAEIERLAHASGENPQDEPAAAKAEPGPETLACVSCGSVVRRGFIYCPTCGRQLWTLCAGCNAQIEEGWRFCVTCGRDLSGESADPRAMRRVLAMHAQRGTEPPSAGRNGGDEAEETTPAPEPTSPPSDSAEQANREGVEFYEQGDLQKAITAFRRAILIDAGKAKYYTNLGVAYGDADMTDEAKDAYEKALLLNPEDPSALLYMGGLLAEEEEYDRARELWERVMAIAPNAPEAREARNNLMGLDNL